MDADLEMEDGRSGVDPALAQSTAISPLFKSCGGEGRGGRWSNRNDQMLVCWGVCSFNVTERR